MQLLVSNIFLPKLFVHMKQKRVLVMSDEMVHFIVIPAVIGLCF